MDVLLKLPRWMVDKIVWILERHPYTGAGEIIEAIKKECTNDT